MKKYPLWVPLSAVLLLLGSCQSQQAFLFRPAAATHTSVAAATRESLAPTTDPAVPQVPQLTAELPAPVASNPTKYSRARAALPELTASMKAPVARVVQSAMLQLAPDTSLVRPATTIPIYKIKETDLLTKLVRVVGVLLVLAAIALLVTAFTTTASGWTALAFLLYGFVVLLISIPFFVFRGKNSPRRQELERRHAARKAAAGQ